MYDVIEGGGKEGRVRVCVRMRGGKGLLIVVDPQESHRESWGDAMAVLKELVGRGCIR